MRLAIAVLALLIPAAAQAATPNRTYAIYAYPPSVAQGDTLHIFAHVDSTRHPDETVTIGIRAVGDSTIIYNRSGAAASVLWSDTFPAFQQSDRDSAFFYGCEWVETTSIQIPEAWPSGAYTLYMDVENNCNPDTVYGWWDGPSIDTPPCGDAHFPVIVKEDDPGSRSNIAVLTGHSTWVAYNEGGSTDASPDSARSLYNDITNKNGLAGRGYGGSVARYYCDGDPEGGISSPVTRISGWEPLRGLPSKYADFDYHWFKWCKQQAIGLEYYTEWDIVQDTTVLRNYDALVVIGHNEYWSNELRSAVLTRISEGMNVAFFTGCLSWWRTRWDNDFQTMYCSKDSSVDPEGVTDNFWEQGLWSNQLSGTDIYGVLYGQSDVSGYCVLIPDHWIFDGTGLNYGDTLAVPLFSPPTGLSEVDGMPLDGELPAAAAYARGTPLSTDVLAIAPADPLPGIDAWACITAYTVGRGTVIGVGFWKWCVDVNSSYNVSQITKNILAGFAYQPCGGCDPVGIPDAEPEPDRAALLFDVQGRLVTRQPASGLYFTKKRKVLVWGD